jgi:hypothetical protein
VSRRRALVVAALVAVTAISTALRAVVPLWVLADAVEDDQLFVRLGSALRAGDWLGPYTVRTLQKGSGFPAFLAVAQQTHLPYLVAVHLLHLGACAAAAGAIGRIGGRRLGCLAYAVLALDPAYYGWGASRVLRDSWYSSLSLLLFALAALALSAARPAGPTADRVAVRWVRVGLIGVVAGAVLAAYWLTRAEHPWLLPALAWLVVAAAVLRQRRGGRPTWRGWLAAAGPVAAGCAIAVAVLALGVGAVAARNQRAYGVALTDDFAGGQFPRLYSQWQSVHAGPERRYVPIGKAKRLAVYRVSPAAAEIEANLEGPQQNFVAGSCRRYGVCDDITAGLIPYAIRNATVSAGRAPSEPAAQRYWGLVADQIAAACKDGRLSCGRPLPMMLPDPSGIDVSAFAASAWSSFGWLAVYGPAETARAPSNGSARSWALFHHIVNGVPDTPAEQGADRARPGAVSRRAPGRVRGRGAGNAAARAGRVRAGAAAKARRVGAAVDPRHGGGRRRAGPGPAARPHRLDVVRDRARVQLLAPGGQLPDRLLHPRQRPAAARRGAGAGRGSRPDRARRLTLSTSRRGRRPGRPAGARPGSTGPTSAGCASGRAGRWRSSRPW